MTVKVLSLTRSPKPTVLASVKLEIVLDGGDSITVDDCRVLRNRQGQLWLAMPSYSIPANGGRSYEYMPAVVLSTRLKRMAEDVALPAFEEWERGPAQGTAR